MTQLRTFFLLACLTIPPSIHARTIVLDAASEADRMAVIAENAPLMSWAAYMPWEGIYYGSAIDIQQGKGFLIRFPMGAIPAGQRITNAELIFSVQLASGATPRLYFWRVLSEWGAGVCHQYRMTRPKPMEWALPGARGSSSDRAIRPTAIHPIAGPGEKIVNLTEDVEIWYAGAAKNQGWLITVEDPGVFARMFCPIFETESQWKLRITFEPE